MNQAISVFDEIGIVLNGKLTDEVLSGLRTGICHGDPHYENCLYSIENGELSFFDFDFCGNGHQLCDIGSFFHYERQNFEICESFLEGYKDIIPLSENEVELIPYFQVLMRLFHLGARSLNADGIKNPIWRNSEIDKTLKDIYQQCCDLT